MTRFVLILTKPPYGCEEPDKALEITSNLMDMGFEAVVYLLGDAVEVTKRSQMGKVGEKLERVAKKGAEIYCSEDDLVARGLGEGRAMDFVKPVKEIFDAMVDDLMERADKVLSC